MLKKMLFMITSVTCINSSHAYKFEIGGEYQHKDFENSSWEYKEYNRQLDVTYHLKSVEINNNPYNEAAFLNRSSNFNALIAYGKYKDGDGCRFKTKDLKGELEIFIPNTNFYFRADAGKYKNELYSADYDDNYKSTYYSAELGYLPINGLLITAGVLSYDWDRKGSSWTNWKYSETILDPTLSAKYVMPLNSVDLNLEAKVRFQDEHTNYRLGADLYIDKTLSVGVTYADISNEYNDDLTGYYNGDKEYSVRAKKFFTPKISLEANVNFGENDKQYTARAAYRF